MKLLDLLKGVGAAWIFPDLTDKDAAAAVGGMEICGVTCDSREVRRGYVFVANRGKLLNGEDFIESALSNGAVCIVKEATDGAVALAADAAAGGCAVWLAVSNTREALSVMCANFYGNPDRKLKMAGITGSNGKTTTAFMADEILRAAAVPAGMLGTVFARTGKSNDASILTTPDSEKLQRYLSEMVESGFKVCTMEVSSIGIAMRRAYGVHYDVFAFNNISREHIDDHGDFQTYYDLKASVVRGLGEDSICVLSADDELTRSLAGQTRAQVRMFSAKDASAYCYIKNLDLSTGRGVFTMSLGGESIEINLGVAGYHNVINALSAAVIVDSLGIGVTAEHIKAGLEAYRGVERRFECIYDRNFKIFDDHYANPGNIDVTFETIHQMKYRAFRICYALRGSRGTTVNRENVDAMLPHLRRLGVDRIVATASVETVMSKDVVTPDEKAVFFEMMSAAGIDVDWYDRLTDAVRASVDMAQDGDVLLLAGCQGMDSGGHIALDYIAAKSGDASVIDAIAGRVCGSLPEPYHAEDSAAASFHSIKEQESYHAEDRCKN